MGLHSHQFPYKRPWCAKTRCCLFSSPSWNSKWAFGQSFLLTFILYFKSDLHVGFFFLKFYTFLPSDAFCQTLFSVKLMKEVILYYWYLDLGCLSFVKFILIFEKQNKEKKITLIFFSEQGKSWNICQRFHLATAGW